MNILSHFVEFSSGVKRKFIFEKWYNFIEINFRLRC